MVTTVDLHRLTDDQLTDHLVAWFQQTLPLDEHRRLVVPILQALATGQPSSAVVSVVTPATNVSEEVRSDCLSMAAAWRHPINSRPPSHGGSRDAIPLRRCGPVRRRADRADVGMPVPRMSSRSCSMWKRHARLEL
jgi:hypothetical protein